MGSKLWLVAAICAGCGSVASSTGDDDVAPYPRTCIVTQTGGGTAERLESQLLAPGQPASTVWTRDGQPYTSWTYAYDAAGLLLAQQQDVDGNDGIPDSERAIAHSATSAVVTWRGLPNGAVGETETFTLDGNDQIVKYESANDSAAFTLAAGGAITRIDEDAIDVDLGPYTRVTEHDFDATGNLIERRTQDTRSGPGTVTETFQHVTAPGTHVVQRFADGAPRAITTHRYDAGGRPTRIEVDDDHDGTGDWIIDIAYGSDGGIAVTDERTGGAVRVTSYSGGCGVAAAAPVPPHAWRRPGAEFPYSWVVLPDAYE